MTQVQEQSKTFLTVAQISARHPGFSVPALRHLIFDSRRNGFDRVIFRIGKKLLLEESSFRGWIEQQQQSGRVK